jgi:hypothetical protein
MADVENSDDGSVVEKLTEKAWAQSLCAPLGSALQAVSTKSATVKVKDGHRLPYALEVLNYQDNEPNDTHSAGYQTDLLAYDLKTDVEGELWTPRVVIECKLGAVTTHDVT